MCGRRSGGIVGGVLSEAEAGRRNRRTIDALVLVAAALGVGCAAVLAASQQATGADVGDALGTGLGWAAGLWRTVCLGAILLALGIAAEVALRRRWALARDLLAAALVAAAAGVALGFPHVPMACVVAVVAVAVPELVRPARVLAAWVVALGALGAVALGTVLPWAALGGLALGLASAALVVLAFGTAAGMPPARHVRAALASLGVDVGDLAVAPRQRVGAAEYVGHDRSGRPLKARVLGRDAQETQKLARRWRLLAYRDPPRSVAVGRLEQVEHEALATLLAAQAEVRVPEVVTAALGPGGDALMVTRQPDVVVLEGTRPGELRDEPLRAVWAQVARLHAAGISHGRLNAANVGLVDAEPVLLDLSAATLGAPQSALDIDVAEFLVASTVLVGPDRALRAALDGIGADAVTRAIPYLQRAALTPHTRDRARAHEVALGELRAAAARATGTAVPEVAALRRVRARDLVLLALVAFAASAVIGELGEIGVGTLVAELRRADGGWLVIALGLAQLALVGGAISVRGSTTTPLALLPCVVLQSAIRFIALTVPSSAGRLAMNLRFLQRAGASTPEAVAAGAVDDVSQTIVKFGLLAVTAPVVGGDLDPSRLAGGAPDPGAIAAVFGALAAGAVVVVAVPALRAKVVPAVRRGLSSLRSVVRLPGKRMELFGGNLLASALSALVLGAACRAYGVDVSLAEVIFVNTAAGVISGLIPVPGGIGAAEATVAAGLMAVGVAESVAFGIAVTKRLCTFYLPPIWGYASLRWLQHRGYL